MEKKRKILYVLSAFFFFFLTLHLHWCVMYNIVVTSVRYVSGIKVIMRPEEGRVIYSGNIPNHRT